MDSFLPESAHRQCEYTAVGNFLWDCDKACWSSTGGSLGTDTDQQGEGKAEGEGEGECWKRGWHREWRVEQGVVELVIGLLLRFEPRLRRKEPIDLIFDVYITTTRFRHVSLHKLTQDLSWLFAVMLQHDQRYLLAEAVYFLLAFFLTLSDHREGIAKASKVPHALFPFKTGKKKIFRALDNDAQSFPLKKTLRQ